MSDEVGSGIERFKVIGLSYIRANPLFYGLCLL